MKRLMQLLGWNPRVYVEPSSEPPFKSIATQTEYTSRDCDGVCCFANVTKKWTCEHNYYVDEITTGEVEQSELAGFFEHKNQFLESSNSLFPGILNLKFSSVSNTFDLTTSYQILFKDITCQDLFRLIKIYSWYWHAQFSISSKDLRLAEFLGSINANAFTKYGISKYEAGQLLESIESQEIVFKQLIALMDVSYIKKSLYLLTYNAKYGIGYETKRPRDSIEAQELIPKQSMTLMSIRNTKNTGLLLTDSHKNVTDNFELMEKIGEYLSCQPNTESVESPMRFFRNYVQAVEESKLPKEKIITPSLANEKACQTVCRGAKPFLG